MESTILWQDQCRILHRAGNLTQGGNLTRGRAPDIWHETFVNLLLRDNIYYHDDDDYDYIDYDDNDIDGCDIELVKSMLSQS